MTQVLHTDRLTLRRFTMDDLAEFTALHTNPVSMVDYGAPATIDEAKEKLARYLANERLTGITRLHVSDAAGFVGYVGVSCHDDSHPLGAHAEIGWRLLPQAWGKGYATEAARAALPHAFAATGLPQILAYTAPDNLKSQAVMKRLRLLRHPELDFDILHPIVGHWHGLVWAACAEDWPPTAP